MEYSQFKMQDIRHELFWNLGGNREGEIFGRHTSGINSLDTHRSFLLLLILPLLLPKPKPCVLSLRKMCCVTTQQNFSCVLWYNPGANFCLLWKICEVRLGFVRYGQPLMHSEVFILFVKSISWFLLNQ